MNFNHRDEGDTLWGSGGSGFVDTEGEQGGGDAWEPVAADPDATAELFGHYAEGAPGVGKPPPPMSRDELEYFLEDSPKAPGVGKPPPPMSRDELESLLE